VGNDLIIRDGEDGGGADSAGSINLLRRRCSDSVSMLYASRVSTRRRVREITGGCAYYVEEVLRGERDS